MISLLYVSRRLSVSQKVLIQIRTVIPEASSTMQALSGAHCTDARLYGTRTTSARERSHG